MHDMDIQSAVYGIRMKDDMRARLIAACANPSKARRNGKPFLIKVAWTSLACLLVLAAIVGMPYLTKNDGEGVTLEFAGTVMAMAMGMGGTDTETTMAMDQSVIMAFRPYASAFLPGLPFTFNFADCEIEVTVNSGHLFEHTDESKIVDHGTVYRFDSDRTVCWSPLSEDTWDENDIALQSDLSFIVFQNGEQVGGGLIAIRILSGDDVYFNEHPELLKRQTERWDYYYRVTLCAYTGNGQLGRNSYYGGAMVGDESMLVEPIDAEDILSADIVEMQDRTVIKTCSQAEIREFADVFNEAMRDSNAVEVSQPLAVRITFTDGTTMTVYGGMWSLSTVERNGKRFDINGYALSGWFEKRLP